MKCGKCGETMYNSDEYGTIYKCPECGEMTYDVMEGDGCNED